MKAYKGPELGDWRDRYWICEHVAKGNGESGDLRHRGFRVCCEACYPEFLYPDQKL